MISYSIYLYLTSLSLISRSVFVLLQRALFHSLLWLSRIPLSTHSSVLAWGTPSWWAAVYGVAQSRTQLKLCLCYCKEHYFILFYDWVGFHCQPTPVFSPGEPHPGGLPSMGSHRVGHNWSNLAAAAGFHCMGFPGGTSGKEPTCQCRRQKGCGFNPWVRKIPWKRAWQHTPAFLLGESHGQRSLMSCSPWDRKESDTTEAT